jgi:hypothetical protein
VLLGVGVPVGVRVDVGVLRGVAVSVVVAGLLGGTLGVALAIWVRVGGDTMVVASRRADRWRRGDAIGSAAVVVGVMGGVASTRTSCVGIAAIGARVAALITDAASGRCTVWWAATRVGCASALAAWGAIVAATVGCATGAELEDWAGSTASLSQGRTCWAANPRAIPMQRTASLSRMSTSLSEPLLRAAFALLSNGPCHTYRVYAQSVQAMFLPMPAPAGKLVP